MTKEEKKILTQPKTKLEFKTIISPTSEAYIEERKKDMPKLVKKLRIYADSYYDFENI